MTLRPAIDNPRIAVVGAGLIGQRHAKLIKAGTDAILSAIVDPTDAARSFAESMGRPGTPPSQLCLAQIVPTG